MATFTAIGDPEIGVDADVDAQTFIKLRDNDQYLKDVVDGVSTIKIPSQALQHVAANTYGLAIDQFNYLSFDTGAQSFGSTVGAAITADYDTGINCDGSRIPIFTLSVSNPGNTVYILQPSLLAKSVGAANHWYLRITKQQNAASSGTQTVHGIVYAIAIA
jgi:hypothetical protein